MESSHELFRRTLDGVVGVGFVQTHTGNPVAAVAWPDTEPKRYLMTDLEGYGVEHVLDESHAQIMDFADLHASDESHAVNADDPSGLQGVDATDVVVDEVSGEQGDAETDETDEKAALSEADQIGEYLLEHGLDVTNRSVIEALREKGVVVQSGQVTAVKEQLRAE